MMNLKMQLKVPNLSAERCESVRKLALHIFAALFVAAAMVTLDVNTVQAQRVVASAQREFAVRLPELVIARGQRVAEERVVDGYREIVIAIDVGGNVPMRLEAGSALAEGSTGEVRDMNGAWQPLDGSIVVASENEGRMREVRVLFRVTLDESRAVLPVIRAVANGR